MLTYLMAKSRLSIIVQACQRLHGISRETLPISLVVSVVSTNRTARKKCPIVLTRFDTLTYPYDE